ncbi:MAG: 4Fe-4S binding protein [Actinobacteria bacterium]|nr:4Fe-4S binding protein [Actinomycetota bacterium]MBU1942549.1 4Fe-4S binding protein [Actinomycetota bacterium]MBU2687206.1 4Fe-4S binding protein [Actinomycetota bacterium]
MKGTQQNKGMGRLVRGTMAVFNHLPLIDRWHPWVRADKTDMRWLPINEDIQMHGDMPMPLAVLDRIVEEASHRVIIDYCGCRRGFKCEHYPVEVGCLLMGDSAMEQHRYPSREVSVEEAKEHSRKAVDAGLVPIIGKARVDNFIFGIKDRSRMVTVCYCCECCCVTRYTALSPLSVIEGAQPHLEGVTITVTDECKGCGKCAEKCYIGAIEVVDKRAVITQMCRACGRCATVCPRDAIEVAMSDPDFVDKTVERIREYVTYT